MKKNLIAMSCFFILAFAATAQTTPSTVNIPEDLNQLYALALDHLLGRDKPIDLIQAARLLQLAAERGHAEAQYILGNAYSVGEMVPVDYAEAARWWFSAAEQGHEKALDNLGNLSYWAKAAAGGDPDALFWLGNAYIMSTPPDYRKAVSSWKAAAEKGQVRASYNLGLAYFNGYGVERNYSESYRFWKTAAEAGHAEAQAGLAELYYQGIGVQKNPSEYLRWITRSAEAGSARSQYNLGMSYAEGDLAPQDAGKALYWLQQSASQGYVDACFNLGAFALSAAKDTTDARLASDLLILAYQFFTVASELDMDPGNKAGARNAAKKAAALMSESQIMEAREKATETLKAILGE
jgi:uncharacterized protein